jgi:fructokinase
MLASQAIFGRIDMGRESRFYGAIEAGGTKFNCAIADEQGKIHAQARFPTQDPASTLHRVCEFLHDGARGLGALAAIGVGSFGPVILDRHSPRYGCIGRTPKAGWSGADMAGMLAREFSCAVGFDTDVNAAALAEHRWGAGQNVGTLVYLTVGTGIGGGILVGGRPLHGLTHPEIGHVHPRRHALDPHFEGVCPFHRDCLEGLASGPAIVARCGAQLEQLDAAHPQWDIEADYVGQLCAQLALTVSPQRIIMGGGVMNQRLLPLIRRRMLVWLGGYIERSEILTDTDGYLVPAALGDEAGVLGALLLAMQASGEN